MSALSPDTSEPNVLDWHRDIGIAVAVTFILSVSVLHRWHAYDLFYKCYSVFFLLIVLTLPWEDVRMKKRTHKLEVWRACLLIMMTAILFRQ